MSGAWWPDVYGTRSLGGIRAMASSAMVFATAVGPGATGLLIDLGAGLDLQMIGMAAIAVGKSVLFAVAARRSRRETQAAAPFSAKV